MCYLCGLPILPNEKWNRDHVPPLRFFGLIVRKLFSPQVMWLYTHVACNSAYREDEEYTVTALVGHARSRTSLAVMEDLWDAFGKGHSQGLIRRVVASFGRVLGPRGEVTFALYKVRVDRIAWKIVRGLYFREMGAVLPKKLPGYIYLILPSEAAHRLREIEWYPAVRDTAPMRDDGYAEVFTYKWVCQKDGDLRGHAVAMLWWDGIIVLAIFHDPFCGCEECVRRRAGVDGG